MNGREFMARVRRLARRNGIAVRFDRTRGKGSHGTLYYGDRHTEVKDHRKPLKTGTLRGMCKRFGIDPNDLQGVPIMATRYSYPMDLHKEPEGGYSVAFPDFHEAFTDGDTLAEAVAEATDCLEEALAGRMTRREEIPAPSPAKGRPTAVPGAVLAAKAALYEALREERLSNSAFAVAMDVQESEVRRMLDPRHATKIGRLEEALARFRKRLVVTVEEAA